MTLLTRLIIPCFLILLSVLWAKPETTQIEFYYGIAQGNYLIGNLEGASTGVQQMLKLDPNYIPALTLNARILLDQSKPELALNLAERAIALEPDNLEHLLLKALVLGNLNRRKEAIEIVEQVIQSAPAQSKQNRVASNLLGLFLMAEGNPDKAAEILNQSYHNDPESNQGNLALADEAYLQKVNQALNQRDFDTAMEAIGQALQLLNDHPGELTIQRQLQLNMLRARILARAGQIDKAIATLQTITNQHPDNMEAMVTLASLYARTERWNLLQNILPDIAKEPKLRDITLYLEGRIALANNRVGTAREAFEQGLRILPDNTGKLRASLEFYLGVCLLKVDRSKEGDTRVVQSISDGFQPETEEEMILASQALLRAKLFPQAIDLLEAITLNQMTTSTEAWNLLGRAQQANGSTSLALSAFNQSLSIQPKQPDVLALRGSLLRKIGDLEGAISDMENALQLDPENPALTYSLGLIYLQLGQLDRARRSIGESAKKLKETPGIHLLHALLAYNTGTVDEASSALKTYLALVPEQTNESAFYLEYVQIAQSNSARAIDTLSQRIETSDASPLLKNFHAYICGILDRKAVLDAAGHAETPEIARQQLCETAYWLAQHERIHARNEKALELLQLAIQIGVPDYPEYQFAQWQLR
jgi:tetratricopeptide (TPR) repeat protein